MKAHFLGVPCPYGMLASLTIADILYRSDWGKHPLSKPEFGSRYSNNLSLIQAGAAWKGKVHEVEGVKYRAYKDWREYGIDLSDTICFSRRHDRALACLYFSDQLRLYAAECGEPKEYNKAVLGLYKTYSLSEFNL